MPTSATKILALKLKVGGIFLATLLFMLR
jgi:hypothetical protein